MTKKSGSQLSQGKINIFIKKEGYYGGKQQGNRNKMPYGHMQGRKRKVLRQGCGGKAAAGAGRSGGGKHPYRHNGRGNQGILPLGGVDGGGLFL